MEVERPVAKGRHGQSPRGGQPAPAAVVALPQLLDVNEVAAVLGVTVRHVRRLVAERRIPFLKWGHYLRFDPGELASWLEQARVVDSRRAPDTVSKRR